MASEVEKRLNQKYQTLKDMVSQFAGYPTNAAFDYSALYPFFEMPLNNVGDATQSSNYHLNTHEFENEVVSFVAELYGNKERHWGYITNGGSEGNLCGLHIARHRYPDGVVYHSEHSHYSIPKAIEITRSHSVVLPVLDNGEMDYDALAEALKQHPGKPAIIMANLGTTMTGAIDDVHRIRAILQQQKVKDCYIHCDGALHGLILPFCDLQPPIQMAEFDSLSISGHKFIGSPIPCGIFITHQHIIESQQRYIEYVRISDSTLTGSRNAITPLILWYAIHHHGYERLKKIARSCLETTQES